MNEERTDFKFWVGLFIGGLIGALTVFFVGTKEGKKAGKYLGQKGKEVLGDIEDQIDDLRESGEELIEKGEALKHELVKEFEHKKNAVSKGVTREVGRALTNLEEVQKTGLKQTAQLKRHFTNLPKKG